MQFTVTQLIADFLHAAAFIDGGNSHCDSILKEQAKGSSIQKFLKMICSVADRNTGRRSSIRNALNGNAGITFNGNLVAAFCLLGQFCSVCFHRKFICLGVAVFDSYRECKLCTVIYCCASVWRYGISFAGRQFDRVLINGCTKLRCIFGRFGNLSKFGRPSGKGIGILRVRTFAAIFMSWHPVIRHIGGVIHCAVAVGIPVDLVGDLIGGLVTGIYSAVIDLNSSVIFNGHAIFHRQGLAAFNDEISIFRNRKIFVYGVA